MHKLKLTKPDGRRLALYGRAPITAQEAPSPSPEPVRGTSHLRWHPLRGEWIAYAAHRQDRTFLPPPEYNPLAPTHDAAHPTEVPAGDWDVAVFDNRFPALSLAAAEAPEAIVPTAPGFGACEVVVFTQDPAGSLGALPLWHIDLLLQVYADRTREIAAHGGIRYVLPFENRGREVGVTLHHPHGQIYAYPEVPPVPARMLAVAREHFARTGEGPLAAHIAREIEDGTRLLYDGPHACAFVPACARYPYETWVAPKAAVPDFAALDPVQRADLARALKTVLTAYDGLWRRPLPYLMAWYQAPTDGEPHPECHLHAEIWPPYRTPDRLKYLAGTELGAGWFAMDALPEEKARELRAIAVGLDEGDGFAAVFGRPAEAEAAAPGRVNLLGEHTDYSDGFVLPIAVPQSTRVGVARAAGPETTVFAAELGERATFTLDRAPEAQWARYVFGCLVEAQAAGVAVPPLDIHVAADVPMGVGLSSSASLEVAVLRALRALLDAPLDDVRIARLAQRAEIVHAGVQCGIMDQMAASLADTDRALFLDTRTLARRLVPLPEGSAILVIDSGVARRLADSAYNARRAECEEAARRLGVPALRDVTDPAAAEALPPPLNRRARHVVSENARVLRAIEGVSAAEFGRLMNASHASLRDDFEVSIPALDTLVAILQRQPGVYGARLTGAGFGGACVALCATAARDAVAGPVLAAYAAAGFEGRVLVPPVAVKAKIIPPPQPQRGSVAAVNRS